MAFTEEEIREAACFIPSRLKMEIAQSYKDIEDAYIILKNLPDDVAPRSCLMLCEVFDESHQICHVLCRNMWDKYVRLFQEKTAKHAEWLEKNSEVKP